MSAPQVSREEERLEALLRYSIVDTAPEQEYDDITLIASQICGTDISLITFIERDRQWFKAKRNMATAEQPRDLAFCSHAILDTDVMVVDDLQQDDRFSGNPLVAADPSIRFYAGAPLVTPDGLPIGTLCVLDQEPRSLTDSQKAALQALARRVMDLLEQRRSLESSVVLAASVEAVLDNLAEGIAVVDTKGHLVRINAAAERYFEMPSEDAEQRRLEDVLRGPETHVERLTDAVSASLHDGKRRRIAASGPSAADIQVIPIDLSPDIAGAVLTFSRAEWAADPSDSASRVEQDATVLLADEDNITRAGARSLLEAAGFTVVADASTADEAVQRAEQHQPDIALLDVRMPGDGVSAIARIQAVSPGTKAVMLTVSDELSDVRRALAAGAMGYILKNSARSGALPIALREVVAGGVTLPREIVAALARAASPGDEAGLRDSFPDLTNREVEVLNLLKQGASTLEIAKRLFLSQVTVRTHISAILKKMKVPTREAALEALRSLDATS